MKRQEAAVSSPPTRHCLRPNWFNSGGTATKNNLKKKSDLYGIQGCTSCSAGRISGQIIRNFYIFPLSTWYSNTAAGYLYGLQKGRISAEKTQTFKTRGEKLSVKRSYRVFFTLVSKRWFSRERVLRFIFISCVKRLRSGLIPAHQ